MFLAGLAFAGANVRDRATDGEDDGILTADEISRLYLSSAEWVVLSACDSGGGRIQLDDGLLGLRRAFQIAGAKTVIGSLWPVDDELTREWMRKLYESRLEEGLDTPASVHAANIALLERLHRDGPSTHPALWGGFVSFGSWR
jgi:CHAT domain-containing protein